MTVYVVLDAYMFGKQIAAIYAEEMDALRHAHEHPLPQGVLRREVEPHTVRTASTAVEALT